MNSMPLSPLISKRYPESWGRSPPHFALKIKIFLQLCFSDWRFIYLFIYFNENMFMTVPPFFEQSAVKSSHEPGISASANFHMVIEGP